LRCILQRFLSLTINSPDIRWNIIANSFFSLRLLFSLSLSPFWFTRSFWIVLRELIAYFLYVCDRASGIFSSIIRRTFVRILSYINECNEEEEARKKKKRILGFFFFISNRPLTNKCSKQQEELYLTKKKLEGMIEFIIQFSFFFSFTNEFFFLYVLSTSK